MREGAGVKRGGGMNCLLLLVLLLLTGLAQRFTCQDSHPHQAKQRTSRAPPSPRLQTLETRSPPAAIAGPTGSPCSLQTRAALCPGPLPCDGRPCPLPPARRPLPLPRLLTPARPPVPYLSPLSSCAVPPTGLGSSAAVPPLRPAGAYKSREPSLHDALV